MSFVYNDGHYSVWDGTNMVGSYDNKKVIHVIFMYACTHLNTNVYKCTVNKTITWPQVRRGGNDSGGF